jgi:hypothetical protein
MHDSTFAVNLEQPAVLIAAVDTFMRCLAAAGHCRAPLS